MLPPSEVLLSPPSFPILTLDEAKLSPALGYLFQRKWIEPYESLVSILWKFQKANALSGTVVANLMGPDIDPYEGIVPELSAVDIERLHGTLGLPKTTLREALLAPTERRRFAPTFRPDVSPLPSLHRAWISQCCASDRDRLSVSSAPGRA